MNRLALLALCAFLPGCSALRDMENGAAKINAIADKVDAGVAILTSQARAADKDGDGKLSWAEIVAAGLGVAVTGMAAFGAASKKTATVAASLQKQNDEHYDAIAAIREQIALATPPPKS